MVVDAASKQHQGYLITSWDIRLHMSSGTGHIYRSNAKATWMEFHGNKQKFLQFVF